MKTLLIALAAATMLLLIPVAAPTSAAAHARPYAAYRPGPYQAQAVPQPAGFPQPVGPACDAVPHVPPNAVVSGAAFAAYRPIVPLFAVPRSYQVGRGILGQAKIYVPGQPIRNALRYLTP